MAKGMLVLEVDRCKGCSLCVRACPEGILRMSTEAFNAKGYRPVEVIEMAGCTGCSICAVVCPDVVFSVYRERRDRRRTAGAAA